MKCGTSLFLTLMICYGPVQAQQLEDALRLFDEANRLVESGAYEDAIDQYHAVIETGYESGALYHNLAGAYYRLDELGEAVRYYERARRLLGNDPQLLHNIQIIESRVQSPFSELPTPFWRTWWNQLFGQYSTLPFLSAGIGLYLIACLLYAQLLWSRTRSSWHRRARAGALASGLILLLIAVVISSERNSIQGASILEPTTMTTEAGSIEIPEGVRVTLVGEAVAGIEVRLPNGIQGYVDANILGEF